MKIAVTGDIHLREEKPERLENLRIFIKEIQPQGIDKIIIAGDLFDKGFKEHKFFEACCKLYPGIDFYIIPGNHDPEVMQGLFGSDNIRVFSEPDFKNFDNKQFLFLPYKNNSSVAKALESREDGVKEIDKNGCYLITHGDVTGSRIRDTGNEEGYFPISKSDIIRFGFKKVFLGHIHKPHIPYENYDIFYPGSLYPLDITETGIRKYIVYDTKTDSVEFKTFKNPVLYDHWVFLVIPGTNEKKQIQDQYDDFISSISQEYGGTSFKEKLTVRVSARGFTVEGVDQIVVFIKNVIKKDSITIDGSIDTSELYKAEDNPALNEIARRVIDIIEDECRRYGTEQFFPGKERIITQALKRVYAV